MKYRVAFVYGILIGFFVGALTVVLIVSPRVDHWRNAYNSASTQSLYFSGGAIDRRLVDLCLRDGEPGVWWKEECDK